LSQLLINTTCLNLGKLSFAGAKFIFIQKHALTIPHQFDSHHQTNWNEIRKADKPTTPSVENIYCNTSS